MAHDAVLLPGMAYGHAYPLMHLSAVTLRQLGATVEQVTYPVSHEWSGDAPFWNDEREARLRRDVQEQISHVSRQCP